MRKSLEELISNPITKGIYKCLKWQHDRGCPPERLRESGMQKLIDWSGPDNLSTHDLDDLLFHIANHASASDYRSELPSSLIPQKGDGFLGDYIDHGLQIAKRRVAPFFLGGAVALASVVISRRVRTETDGRPNIMIICCGPSGSGKDAPRQLNKQLAHAGGASDRIAPDSFFSGSGIITALQSRLAALFHTDEIGRLLCAQNSKAADANAQGSKTKLLSLYSSANGVYQPDSYANEERNVSINQPHCILYGSTVPESLFTGLTKESLSDGFISRILIFDTLEVPEMQFAPILELPASCVEFIRQWNSWFGDYELPMDWEQIEPKTIPYSPEARNMLTDYYKECDKRADSKDEDDGSSLWRRASEKAEKLALIKACSYHSPSDDFRIEEDHLKWGIDVVSWLTTKMLVTAGDHLSENQQEAKVNRVYRVIKGKRGAPIIKRDLTRKTQFLSDRERGDILRTLIESERIKSFPTGKTIAFSAN